MEKTLFDYLITFSNFLKKEKKKKSKTKTKKKKNKYAEVDKPNHHGVISQWSMVIAIREVSLYVFNDVYV